MLIFEHRSRTGRLVSVPHGCMHVSRLVGNVAEWILYFHRWHIFAWLRLIAVHSSIWFILLIMCVR